MIYGLRNWVQAELVLYALGAGFWIGLLYAFLMALRAFIRHNAAAVAAEDVLFFTAAAFLTFMFLLDYNYGIVRGYLIASETAGFLLIRGATAKIIVKIKKTLATPNSDSI